MNNTKSYWVITWGMSLHSIPFPLADKDRIETLIETLHRLARNSCVAGFDAYRKSNNRTYVTIICRDAVIYMSIKMIFKSDDDDKARDALINYILGEENELAKKVISDVDALEVYAEITTAIDAENGMNKDEYEYVYKLIKLLELALASVEYRTSCS